MHVTKNEPSLLGVHWPPAVILIWWHQHKTNECTSIGCSAKFVPGVWNFSLYKFSDFLEKRVSHRSRALSYQFVCHQVIWIHCLIHPQPNIFIWKKPGHIWCANTSDLSGQKFQLSIQQFALCCCHCCGGESGYECVGFSLHKWKFLPS